MKNKNIIFIAGVHGVGKSTFCDSLSLKTEAFPISASTLIKRSIALNNGKIVDNVNKNQNALIEQLSQLDIREDTILLDGHFCLIDKNKNISDVPIQTFVSIDPTLILLLKCDAQRIQDRLSERDGAEVFDKYLIDELQKYETNRARLISKTINVPIIEIDTTLPFTDDFLSRIAIRITNRNKEI
tara:strand:- start:1539 stop:2093 length:555 start_codon:yes stop_codon:yes gene_type:complete